MSASYHVRIRGRVHGPFDLAKTRELIQKGRLGRMHEVSLDGRTWEPVGSRSELFESASESVQTRPSVNSSSPPQSRDIDEEGWYYSQHGENAVGPVSFRHLQSLATTGALSPQDQLWAPNAQQWAEAGSFIGLASHFRKPGPSSKGNKAESEGELDLSEIEQAVGGAAGWRFFVTLWLLLFGLLTVLAAFAPRVGAGPDVSPRLIALAFGLSLVVSGCFLWGHCRQIRALRYRFDEGALKSYLRSENRFWFASGLGLLITFIAILVAVAVEIGLRY
ncbi:GYF domain-containing protein [Botrimarina sp.]|uniref:GYF domain-containing protein n=1 Tax=Botrimarina sp. TaxID=2795802 RepID=UPI0032EF77FE